MSAVALTFEVWNVGAQEPMLVTPSRQKARTRMLAEAGFMCQDGSWLYRSSMITGSSILEDSIVLCHVDDADRICKFEVRPVRADDAEAVTR